MRRCTCSAGVVRARISTFSATCAVEIHTFCPVTILVAPSFRAGAELRRVEPGIRFRDGEAGTLAPGDERGQHAPLLRVRAEHHHGVEPEDVHVHGRGAAHAGPRFRHRLHHDRRLHDPEPGAAIVFRHADAEPAIPCERLVQLGREAPVAVARQPVLVIEGRADARDGVAHRNLLVAQGEIHRGSSFVRPLPDRPPDDVNSPPETRREP